MRRDGEDLAAYVEGWYQLWCNGARVEDVHVDAYDNLEPCDEHGGEA